ncbi:hypothetical protein sce4116 [Sorangium cellulosum So ce56]|uniref:Uncharacterized protein n=1 Tax=Sorangium cellulosum (strain So ce56) TaxID=448385 RepID=A9EW19_SORC5|nr:hypothetical protein sce4116 [Sorangium cellulosum So ce56]
MAEPSTPPSEQAAEPRLLGVTLAQVAAIHAGLAEGFPLDVVLANEGVAPAAHDRAMSAWAQALADDLDRDGTPLNEAYDVRLARAQDRYARRVLPLSEDLRAWLCFARHWSSHPDPLSMLAPLGLHAADLVRLHRAWARRIAAEPALLREVQGVLASDHSPLPEIRIEPARLTPPGPPDPTSFRDIEPPSGDGEFAERDDDAGDPHEEPAADGAGEVPAIFAPLEELDTNASCPPRGPGEPPPAGAGASRGSPRPPSAIAPRTEATVPAGRRALPSFLLADEPQRPKDPALQDTASAASAQHGSMDAIVATARRPPPAGESGPYPSADARADAPDETPPPSTADPDSISVQRNSFPFMPPDPAEPRPSGTEVHPAPPAFSRTIAAPLVPHRPDLPFHPAETQVRHGYGAAAGAPPTSMSDRDPVLPFRKAIDSSDARRSPPPPSPLPRSPDRVPPAGPLQELSLAQYASLCAELAVFPGAAEAIFQRYGLRSQQARRAVDAAWKERLGRDTAAHGAWQEMYRRYHDYWTKRGAPAK